MPPAIVPGMKFQRDSRTAVPEPWPFSTEGVNAMYFIDPHIHIASRTTDDLARMAKMGCRAVAEPAFWMGYDRTSVSSFYDYFRQLTEWEPKRTTAVGIQHYCFLGINSKEAERVDFAREVIAVLPEFGLHLFQSPTGNDIRAGLRQRAPTAMAALP